MENQDLQSGEVLPVFDNQNQTKKNPHKIFEELDAKFNKLS